MKKLGDEALLVLIVAVPLTFWLAAPPVLQGDLPQRECAELVANTKELAEQRAEATWNGGLLPQWLCTADGLDVASFGWWATPGSDSTPTD